MKTLSIAIIAHVDHGKTTLTDHLLRQGGAFAAHEEIGDLVMDSNALERERGITILSKNASIHRDDVKINIVDTPGHADFGSEVERVLKTVDSVLLLVDAKEGPMPQTKFVLKKSLQLGLRPILLINKIDKPDQRAHEVVDMVFDLFVTLGATNEQLDFPIVYTIGKLGIAKHEMADESTNLDPLFETIFKHVPLYPDRSADPLQMQVTTLAYDDYVGRIGIGRVAAGSLQSGQQISLCRRDGSIIPGKITKLFVFEGLKQVEVESVEAGDICAAAGIDDITIGETIADKANPVPLPMIEIDEPTMEMNFLVNNSPFAGREGKFVTNRHLRERLDRELETNVGLRVEPLGGVDGFKVSGRGELHLSVLLENMRREGYEIQVSKPEVIFKEIEGKRCEPIEQVLIDVPDEFAGAVIEKLGRRKGEMVNMIAANGVSRIEYSVPTRGLIGFRSDFITDTKGEGILDHSFLEYQPYRGEISGRLNGVLIAGENGVTMAYSLWNLQERGKLFIGPGVEVYIGMVLGQHSRDNDLTVNPCKGKKLTNMRASGSDESVRLVTPVDMTLELALEYIENDELVEVTPTSIRIRKKYLTENERKRAKG
ncbi:translational GTPase TypA [Candidatus Peregrinibacteria bacterium CG_4_9_14_0_2_um_filter_53_11]|nr:MAG: translational GTPase TypA [Candidatus Peregrinibacteria bacterium CG_4_9_14_0_2_um_filter_53_11]